MRQLPVVAVVLASAILVMGDVSAAVAVSGSCMRHRLYKAGFPTDKVIKYERNMITTGLTEQYIVATHVPILRILLRSDLADAKNLQDCIAKRSDKCSNYNPCHNGGVCRLNQQKKAFVCACHKHFTGKFCTTPHSAPLGELRALEEKFSKYKNETEERLQIAEEKLQKSSSALQSFKSDTARDLSGLKTKLADAQIGLLSVCPRYPTASSRVFQGTTRSGRVFSAFCDQSVNGGGWTVFQRRKDGSIDFDRGWADYRRGFGSPTGEFWLGLDTLHLLTSQVGVSFKLRIDITIASTAQSHYMECSKFTVGDLSSKFQIHFEHCQSPTLQVSEWMYHNDKVFATKDQDKSTRSCSQLYSGGWWFKNCYIVNLNGIYGLPNSNMRAANWRRSGTHYSIGISEMKFRQV